MASHPPQWIRTLTGPSHRQIQADAPRARKPRSRRTGDIVVRQTVKKSSDGVKSDLDSTSALLVHKPSCPQTKFAAHFIDIGERCELFASWMNLVPMRLGSDHTVDAAALGMVKAIEFLAQKHSTGASMSSALLPYHIRAISSLRTALASPTSSSKANALLAVGLVQTLEWAMAPLSEAALAHSRGNAAILTSDPPIELSETTRAILFWVWDVKFGDPVELGIPSPFEEPRWLEAEPANKAELSSSTRKLAILHNQLFIRLPRLIVAARALRIGNRGPLPKAYLRRLRAAVQLADELLELQDSEAESESLHGVHIQNTKLPQDSLITRYSFHYHSLDHFSNMLCYWQTRILAVRLYLQLYRNPSLSYEHTCDLDSLAAENIRMATNIIMSWEFAISKSAVGFHALRVGFLAVWGVTMDVATWSRDLTVTSLRRWIVQCYNELCMIRGVAYTHKDMDEAAEMLVGGPLNGLVMTGPGSKR